MKLLLPLLLPLADAKFSLRRSSNAMSVRKLYNMDYVNNMATSVQFSACVTLKTNSAVAQQLNADVYETIQSGNYQVTQQVEGEDQVDGEGNVQESALDAVYSVQNYAIFNRALQSYNGSDVSDAADLHMTSLDNYVLSLGELGEDKDTAAEEICDVCNSWGQLSYNYCSKGYKSEDEWENEINYEESEMQVTAQYNSMLLDCDTCYQFECWDIEGDTEQQQNEGDDQDLTDDTYILEWVAEVGGCVESGCKCWYSCLIMSFIFGS